MNIDKEIRRLENRRFHRVASWEDERLLAELRRTKVDAEFERREALREAIARGNGRKAVGS